MFRYRNSLISFAIASTLLLSACNSGRQADEQQTPSAATSAASPTAGQQFHATVALRGTPAISADGKSIVVAVTVTNTGDATFGTTISPNANMNLGAHGIDDSGNIIDQDLARGTLPHIAPGASAIATILLPVDKVLNRSAQILPVQEGVAWFDRWGNKPLIVGPFSSCGSSAVGTVCDASGKPLLRATPQP